MKKTYLAKVDRSTQKPKGRPLSRTFQQFQGHLVSILDFGGSHRKNYEIKKLILRKLIEGSKNLRLAFLQTPSAILAPLTTILDFVGGVAW